MTDIFGHFNDDLPMRQEYLTLKFSPSSVPVQQRWRNNGLSADFMADYFATFFPGNEETTDGISLRSRVKGAVSFIANELLENAMKFTDETSLHPISITLEMHSNILVFIATNSINYQAIAKFQSFIKTLLYSNPSDLYLRQLEDESLEGTGLGLLTMINDYYAKIGWRFETIQKDPEVVTVTTMVQLKV